jgi:hypothetical protein
VLNLEIGDGEISDMMSQNQHDTVEQNLKIAQLGKELEFTKKTEEISRQKLDERIKTNNKEKEVELIKVNNQNSVEKQKVDNTVSIENAKLKAELEMQESINVITTNKKIETKLLRN